MRVKRAVAMDITTAGVFEAAGRRLEARGGSLLLVGMRPRDMALFERTGLADRLGRENLFPTEPGWFVAMQRAVDRARTLAGEHACGDACPLDRWTREVT